MLECLIYNNMPELPEVETIRRDLSAKIINKKFKAVAVRKPKIIRGAVASFKRRLLGRRLKNIDRVGKLLIFNLDAGLNLLIHLKMTGQLIHQKRNELTAGGHSQTGMAITNLPNQYSHVIFTLSDNSELFFNDLRQFGYLKLTDSIRLKKIIAAFGLNPLTSAFTPSTLAALIQNRRAPIKSILLNQNLIAGIGNIYADESCFLAGIKPSRLASSLSARETDALVCSIKSVLSKSIKYRGTTFNNFRDASGRRGDFLKYLKVYKKTGQPCSLCATPVQKIKISGRGTHFCPSCQK